jgi:hypothetical protein
MPGFFRIEHDDLDVGPVEPIDRHLAVASRGDDGYLRVHLQEPRQQPPDYRRIVDNHYSVRFRHRPARIRSSRFRRSFTAPALEEADLGELRLDNLAIEGLHDVLIGAGLNGLLNVSHVVLGGAENDDRLVDIIQGA